jgi:hypothetical protein
MSDVVLDLASNNKFLRLNYHESGIIFVSRLDSADEQGHS